ncbi:phosphodiesterase [Elysia marginata]|uniref:Phosphodiesterase n=1 Tax=Elysia marginata TaxID=1093978 RepID=A0AAV4JNR7_9GAST|nr:phosphodiesterase [Elysia marginata]
MGNGSSFEQAKTVFLEINGKEEKIIFSRHTSSRDIHELIAQAANVNKHAIITLRDRNGAHVSVSPTMPQNTSANPYKVHAKDPPAPTGKI